MADRHFGPGGGRDLAQLRHAALAHTTAMAFAREMPTTPAAPGQNNWTPLGPLAIANGQTLGGNQRVIVTGRVTEIVPHPTNADTIYVASARGGIWKTTDGGDTWTAKSDNADSLAIGSLDISRSNPDTLYAGTGEGNIFYYVTTFPLGALNESYNGSGILKTTNGGATWTTQGGGSAGVFTGACFYRVRVHPTDPNTVLAATSRGLYRTTDGGTNWVRLSSGLPSIGASVIGATDVAFDPVTPATAYAAFWGSGVYKCTDVKAATPSWSKLAEACPLPACGAFQSPWHRARRRTSTPSLGTTPPTMMSSRGSMCPRTEAPPGPQCLCRGCKRLKATRTTWRSTPEARTSCMCPAPRSTRQCVVPAHGP
jgi:hypothetical protein